MTGIPFERRVFSTATAIWKFCCHPWVRIPWSCGTGIVSSGLCFYKPAVNESSIMGSTTFDSFFFMSSLSKNLGAKLKFTGSANTKAPLCASSPCYNVDRSILRWRFSSNLIDSGMSISLPKTSLLKGLPVYKKVSPAFTLLMKYSAFTWVDHKRPY